MSKKIVAMLMAVAMAFSLLPVTAFATGEKQEGNSQTPVPVTKSENNLTMNKTVKPNKDGTYTVSLESYATGSVTPTQAPVPMDIVLVLDVSGSMDGQIAFYDYQKTEKTSWSAKDFHFTGTTYYAKIGEEYYPVSCQSKRVPDKYFGHNEYWLEANGQPLGNTGEWGEQLYSGSLYTYGKVPGSQMSRLAAMKTAVNNFIDSVAAQKNGDTPVAHRISIVKFAGDPSDKVSNDTYQEYGDTYNYTQKVKELTDVTAAGSVASLKNAVNDLTAGGATAADWGMQKAKDVLTKRGDNPNPSIVIMFTDGEPNHGSGYKASVAGDTVQAAKALKDSGTKVYTIGMFTGADPTDTAHKFNIYMNGVSSNYPEAVKAYNTSGVTLGKRANGSYYFKADNAGDLDQVFQTISQSTTVTSPLNASAVVVDNVPSNFALTENSVKVYTANCIAKNGDEFTWGKATPAQEISSTPTKNQDGSQTISTTGFDFSKNWCGLDSNNEATGKKLIIEFTISCTNYGGTQPTNAGAYIKANADSTDRIIWVDDPEVPVTVQLPKVNNPADKTKDYKGAGYDITNEISEIIAGLVPVDGIKNQFIDLTYEIKDSSGNTVGTYTIPAGATTGKWSDTSTNITTGSNVGNYTYKITVTGQDTNKEQPNNKASKECTATFTITQKEVTFKGQTDTKEWNGQKQEINTIIQEGLLTGHTYDGLTYAATGTEPGTYNGEFTGSAIIKDAAGTDVTANYKVKTEPGTLTITDSTRKVTVTFKIVGGTWNGDNPTAENKTVNVQLTNGKGSLKAADIPTGSPSKGHTGDGVWSNDANISGDPVEGMEITQNTLFTLTYPESKPVESEVDVTFKIDGGKWSNGKTEDITRVVKLTNGTGSLAGVEIPTGVADADHQGDGTWSPATPEAGTVITQDGNKVFTLTFQKKEEQKPADPVKWDVSRSKTASGLTKNSNGEWTTDVTLGLPSATTKQTIDVVLVVDNAFPKDNTTAATQAAGLMEQLEKIAKSGTVSINTGLVISGGYIPVLHRIELGNIEDNITNINEAIDNSKTDWKQQEGRKGSNIQAGVETARQMLAGETSASKENKYLVLISDGGAFSWYENGTSVSKFYSTETDPEKPNYHWCNPWDFQMRYGDGVSSTEFDFAALMKKPETEVDANSIPCPSEEWPSTGNEKNGEGNQTQYQSNYSKATVQSTLDKYPGKCAYDIVNKEGYITSREAALYHTAKSISMASNEVKVIFVSFPYNYNNGSNLFKLTEGFKQYVADNNDNVTLYRVNGRENYPDEYQARDSVEVFKSVKKDLIYLVDKGSKVEDTIGNKFTLIPDSFKLTVGGTELQSIKNGETYYFGDEKVSTTAYKFKVTVTKTGSETKFNWDINEAITKDKPVKLTYTLKLTDPQTLAGTYGVKDLNGDGIVDGTKSTTVVDGDALYTNKEAKLVPKDSNGKTGAELTFPKPSVFYTIKSSSGSHSGGSRPSLNTKDHYGYIIGYPVDYYTGQPTTDQTKKPVRPEGKITRAEVATIYFRMLTDESRTKFWSQSNSYSDVKTGDWFNNAVSTLSKAGIIAGYEDGSFRPNGYITRAEFATIAARFFDVTYNGKDLFPDISGHWAKDYINQAANKGFVNGYEDGTFKPDRNITRAEAVTLVNRTLDRHPDKNHFTKDMLVWPDNMDQTKWYYADMQEATNSHTYQMKENSDKTKYENWTKTLPIRNWEALEKAWSNANSSQGNGNVV